MNLDTHTDPQPQETELVSTDRSTILLIEDDPLQVDFLKTGLSKQGFEVLTSTSCQNGWRLARDEHPDAILLDIGLPDGCGLELCCRLSDSPATTNIPVIIISGNDQDDIVRQCRKAGCCYFVHKPFDPNTLLLVINQAIDSRTEW